MARLYTLILCLLLLSCGPKSEKKEIKEEFKGEVKTEVKISQPIKATISFKSKDGLAITADVYGSIDNTVILLCHQAGFSRGEYNDTALRIMDEGFSSMAIDQRSGKEANGVLNKTALKATEQGLNTHYLDARQDIEAAIDYLYANNGGKPIILVGSSYSATLAMLIGTESDKVRAVIAFSPGEYFKGMSIKTAVESLKKPTFVTSSKKEAAALTEMVSLMNKSTLMHYIPEEEGIHGSRALWATTEGNEGYWNALSEFYTAFLGN